MEFFFLVFGFVLAIVLISTIGGILSTYIKARAQTAASRRSDEEQDLLAEIARLEARIQVLERIVTDDRYDLQRRFRELG